jgi:hypothetical protein
VRQDLIIREYWPTDPTRMTPREDFAREHDLSGQPLFSGLRPEGVAWTLKDGPALWAPVLACGGLSPLGHDRWAAWLFASPLDRRGWVKVAHAFRGLTVEVRARRVEANVRADADPGVMRFAERLGLSHEGLMKGYGPDGADYHLYGGLFR